jgi:hypothetical protein
MTPLVKEIFEKGHLMNNAQSISSLADVAIEAYKDTWPNTVYIYGIRWKGTFTYIYMGLTKWPSWRIDDHKKKTWLKQENGELVRKKATKDDNIEIVILLELEEHPYLVYEYEHRFSLEYLKRGHPLQIREFYTDQTIAEYDYISAPLDDSHIKSLLAEFETIIKFTSAYPLAYHPTYHELYTAIREKTGTTHYHPIIDEPRLWRG